MLVCYNKNETWTRKYDGAQSAPVDACIVTTHMMLMAHTLGVGSTWVMHFDPSKMREAFKIPENIEPVALLVMGYPADDAAPLDMHFKSKEKQEFVFYNEFFAYCNLSITSNCSFAISFYSNKCCTSHSFHIILIS